MLTYVALLVRMCCDFAYYAIMKREKDHLHMGQVLTSRPTC